VLNPNEVLKDEAVRARRVEQLKQLYAEREESEVSPFDDGSADLQNFVFDNLW
jgi:hypothetical protein